MASVVQSQVMGEARGEGAPQEEWLADVEAARSGSRPAFERLYRRHAPVVHGVLLARVPPQVADDLVQDVFVEVLRGLSTLREPARFGSWVATIARRRAAEHLRRDRPVTQLPDELTAPRRHDHEALAVLRAIQTLPEAYREPLVLRLVEGMTGPEIARRLDMTHGSVRVNLTRGMTKLRAKLEETRDG